MRILYLLMGALLIVTTAGAQSNALEADIPFSFEMTGTVYPAGEYRIELREGWIVAIHRETETRGQAITVGSWPGKTSWGPAKVVFHQYGDRHFLSQVEHPYSIRQLPKSKQERELVTSRVIAQARPVRVVIAAKLVR